MLIFFLVFVSRASADAPPLPVAPLNHVVDLAGIIDDSTEQNLNGYLMELEQKTTAQVIVLTVSSLEGESIEDFSITVAHDRWKLGQKGKDNGILITVSLMDRKYRIEVGYGLEGILPDSLAGSLAREHLVPSFRKGDYSTGIFSVTLAISNIIAEHEGVEISGMPRTQTNSSSYRNRSGGFARTIISFLFLLAVIILFIRHPRLLLLFLLLSSGGGRRGSWGGGGGFGGGGFGGGGGGGFGGGGASGGW